MREMTSGTAKASADVQHVHVASQTQTTNGLVDRLVPQVMILIEAGQLIGVNATFPIDLPPLRERREDVPSLASRMLAATPRRHGKDVSGFTEEAMASLLAHAWPGNVRELANEIERAIALAAKGEALSMEHLSARLRPSRGSAAPTAAMLGANAAVAATPAPEMAGPSSTEPIVLGPSLPDSLCEARDIFEAAFIRRMLERHQGNATRAAQAMGISRASIQNKLRDYKLR